MNGRSRTHPPLPAEQGPDNRKKDHREREKRIAGLTVCIFTAAAVLLDPAGSFSQDLAENFVWTEQTIPFTSNHLWGVSVHDEAHAWAVGDHGTILFYNGNYWEEQTSGTTANLFGVHALDANRVWAVGAGGKILRTTNGGNTWTAQASGVTYRLRGVYASSSTSVWAVGEGPGGSGTVLYHDGSTWTRRYLTGGCLNAVSGRYGRVWAVGDGGTIWNYRTGSWIGQNSHTSRDLRGVCALDHSHAWAVGAHGTALRTDDGGVTWTLQNTVTGTAFHAVSATGPDTVWAVGDRGLIGTYDGSVWRNEHPTEKRLNGVAALDAEHVWVVGQSGTILFDLGCWEDQTRLGGLRAVSAADADHVWAVGEQGKALFYDGASWARQPTGTTEDLLSVFAVSPGRAWAVGDGGTILVHDGLGWSLQPSGTGARLRGVGASSTIEAWAVGDDGCTGEILYFNGATWNLEATVEGYCLNAVSALDDSHVWVMGQQWAGGEHPGFGIILFYDGTSWTEQDPPFAAQYHFCMPVSISAIDPDNVWAAGFWVDPYSYGWESYGAAIRCDGQAWDEGWLFPSDWVHGVSALDPAHVWVLPVWVGDVWFYNGSRWREQSAQAGANVMYGISAADAQHVWAVGTDRILFGHPGRVEDERGTENSGSSSPARGNTDPSTTHPRRVPGSP